MLLDEIGSGVSSVVYSASAGGGEKKVAVKIFNFLKDFQQEVSILKHLQRHFLIGEGYFQDMGLHCLVMKRYYLSMYNLQLYKNTFHRIACDNLKACNVPESMHRQIVYSYMFKSVFENIVQIHRKGVVHLDIKPPNFMIQSLNPSQSNYLHVELIDYGRSVRVNSDGLFEDAITNPDQAPGGAYSCQPLEVLRVVKRYAERKPVEDPPLQFGKKVDAFSVGVMLYTMIIQSYPNGILESDYDHLDPIMARLRSQAWKEKQEFLSLHPTTQDFIVRLMEINENERMSCEEALDHPFLSLYLKFT